MPPPSKRRTTVSIGCPLPASDKSPLVGLLQVRRQRIAAWPAALGDRLGAALFRTIHLRSDLDCLSHPSPADPLGRISSSLPPPTPLPSPAWPSVAWHPPPPQRHPRHRLRRVARTAPLAARQAARRVRERGGQDGPLRQSRQLDAGLGALHHTAQVRHGAAGRGRASTAASSVRRSAVGSSPFATQPDQSDDAA